MAVEVEAEVAVEVEEGQPTKEPYDWNALKVVGTLPSTLDVTGGLVF
jgi:hypothetical protein